MQVLASLEDIKSEFAESTGKEADAFKARVSAFYETFKQSGPGRGAAGLPAGLKAMRETDAELATMLAKRDELVLAQKLFAMDITPYPELTNVRTHKSDA